MLILINSFVLSLTHVIISGILNFVSSFIILFSFRSKSTHYSAYVPTYGLRYIIGMPWPSYWGFIVWNDHLYFEF